MRTLVLQGALFVVCLSAGCAFAQNRTVAQQGEEEQSSANLDEGAPLDIEDSRPFEPGQRQGQAFARIETEAQPKSSRKFNSVLRAKPMCKPRFHSALAATPSEVATCASRCFAACDLRSAQKRESRF